MIAVIPGKSILRMVANHTAKAIIAAANTAINTITGHMEKVIKAIIGTAQYIAMITGMVITTATSAINMVVITIDMTIIRPTL